MVQNSIESSDISMNTFLYRNPSIEGDTAFKPCQSSTGIFCQEISNDLTSTVMPDIMEQLHYQTWHEIEESYAKSNS